MRLNWSRGAWRLWLVGTVVWIALVGAMTRPDRDAMTYWAFRNVDETTLQRRNQERPSPQPTTDSGRTGIEHWSREELVAEAMRRRELAKEDLLAAGAFALLPPGLVLLLGAGMLWAVRGFAPSP